MKENEELTKMSPFSSSPFLDSYAGDPNSTLSIAIKSVGMLDFYEQNFSAVEESFKGSLSNISHAANETSPYPDSDAIWWTQIFVQFLYGVVCLVGLCGNMLVIYVVVRFSKMQTVTNLYIVNLAIADECFLVGIPFLMCTAILGYWPFGNIMCKAYFTSTSINQITSSMFLLIMSADRYLAICQPIRAPKWRTPLIAKIVSLTAWTLSALLMVPIFMYANTLEIHNKVNCNIFWPESETMSGEMIFIVYSFFLGFAVPFILISAFYVLVVRRLRTVGPKQPRTNRNTNENDTNKSSKDGSSRSRGRRKSHRKVTKLVLTVVTVYFICWSPYWATQMALMFMQRETAHSSTVLILFLIAGCLSYSNSAMNPILYAFLSDNFKKSFLKACSCAARKDVNAMLQVDNSVMSRGAKGSRRGRKISTPLISGAYTGNNGAEITMAGTSNTRSTMVFPSHSTGLLTASPVTPPNVPVGNLIPDLNSSSNAAEPMQASNVFTDFETYSWSPPASSSSSTKLRRRSNIPEITISLNDGVQDSGIQITAL